VPRNERELGAIEFALDDMQIGSADATDADCHQHFTRARFRHRKVIKQKRIGTDIPGVSENHCFHDDERTVLGNDEENVM
jgi:hypothetical protein